MCVRSIYILNSHRRSFSRVRLSSQTKNTRKTTYDINACNKAFTPSNTFGNTFGIDAFEMRGYCVGIVSDAAWILTRRCTSKKVPTRLLDAFRQNEGENNRNKGKRRGHPDRHKFTTVVLVPGLIANFVITTTIARWLSQLTAMHVPEPIHDGQVYQI